jgi:hypothetical protein
MKLCNVSYLCGRVTQICQKTPQMKQEVEQTNRIYTEATFKAKKRRCNTKCSIKNKLCLKKICANKTYFAGYHTKIMLILGLKVKIKRNFTQLGIQHTVLAKIL